MTLPLTESELQQQQQNNEADYPLKAMLLVKSITDSGTLSQHPSFSEELEEQAIDNEDGVNCHWLSIQKGNLIAVIDQPEPLRWKGINLQTLELGYFDPKLTEYVNLSQVRLTEAQLNCIKYHSTPLKSRSATTSPPLPLSPIGSANLTLNAASLYKLTSRTSPPTTSPSTATNGNVLQIPPAISPSALRPTSAGSGSRFSQHRTQRSLGGMKSTPSELSILSNSSGYSAYSGASTLSLNSSLGDSILSIASMSSTTSSFDGDNELEGVIHRTNSLVFLEDEEEEYNSEEEEEENDDAKRQRARPAKIVVQNNRISGGGSSGEIKRFSPANSFSLPNSPNSPTSPLSPRVRGYSPNEMAPFGKNQMPPTLLGMMGAGTFFAKENVTQQVMERRLKSLERADFARMKREQLLNRRHSAPSFDESTLSAIKEVNEPEPTPESQQQQKPGSLLASVGDLPPQPRIIEKSSSLPKKFLSRSEPSSASNLLSESGPAGPGQMMSMESKTLPASFGSSNPTTLVTLLALPISSSTISNSSSSSSSLVISSSGNLSPSWEPSSLGSTPSPPLNSIDGGEAQRIGQKRLQRRANSMNLATTLDFISESEEETKEGLRRRSISEGYLPRARGKSKKGKSKTLFSSNRHSTNYDEKEDRSKKSGGRFSQIFKGLKKFGGSKSSKQS